MDAAELNELVTLARTAAAQAAAFLLNERPEQLKIETKSTPTDVVSAMDRGAEHIIVQCILDARPDDGLLGEEGAERSGTTGVRWVIDPLDGTVNYLYRLPHWGVAIGIESDGLAVAGVVNVPRLGLEYVGVAGAGAFCVEAGVRRTLSASSVRSLGQALVGTGFNYDASVRERQARGIAEVIPIVRDIRRLGAGAVDLCLVADGMIDAYFEFGLHPWDLCAGSVIANEAGAVLCGVHGAPAGPQMVIASAPGIADELVALVERSVEASQF